MRATSKFLAPQEVADELGVDVQTVRRWIHAGRLRAFKPGKEYRIQNSDLEEFLRAREVRPKAPSRSPLEPSLLNGLEEERRASGVAEAIVAAAERWGADVANPDIPESKRYELIKVATELGDLIGSRLDEDDWATIPLQERREIAMTTAKLDKVASRGTSQMNEETRKRMAKALDKAESRKKFREWNRATQQETA